MQVKGNLKAAVMKLSDLVAHVPNGLICAVLFDQVQFSSFDEGHKASLAFLKQAHEPECRIKNELAEGPLPIPVNLIVDGEDALDHKRIGAGRIGRGVQVVAGLEACGILGRRNSKGLGSLRSSFSSAGFRRWSNWARSPETIASAASMPARVETSRSVRPTE